MTNTELEEMLEGAWFDGFAAGQDTPFSMTSDNETLKNEAYAIARKLLDAYNEKHKEDWLG